MMTTAGRALRNALDLLATLPEEEALAFGRELYRDMDYHNVIDILQDAAKTLCAVDAGAAEKLPK